MDEKKIRNSFKKIRKDLVYLAEEILVLKQKMIEIASNLEKKREFLPRNFSTENSENSTLQTHLSTHNIPFNALKVQNMPVSIGNQGVSTDRQTDRQTDNNPPISSEKLAISEKMRKNR